MGRDSLGHLVAADDRQRPTRAEVVLDVNDQQCGGNRCLSNHVWGSSARRTIAHHSPGAAAASSAGPQVRRQNSTRPQRLAAQSPNGNVSGDPGTWWEARGWIAVVASIQMYSSNWVGSDAWK